MTHKDFHKAQGSASAKCTPRTLSFQHRFRSGALCSLEVDLAEVRINRFRPHFKWSGRSYKRRELVRWIVGVFQVVATRAEVPIVYVFSAKNGESESWLCDPGQRPRRLPKESEPCHNSFNALVLALKAKVVTESYEEAQ
jgi:hypothetical protein